MNFERTPLELELLRLIEAEGPLPLDRYMALCLSHPRYGYYMSRDPFGAGGDFITAPEVTQMFGEIIGVWCAHCFDLMGRPEAFALVELGPGRGTLMSDILRTLGSFPDILSRLSVHLVETSPVLSARQQALLSGAAAAVTWHEALKTVPEAPAILIANEFFDALPLRQFERRSQGWAERAVGLRDGKLTLGLLPAALEPPSWAAAASPGDVAEICPAALRHGASIGGRLARRPGAALIIDYGHSRSALGDTLQAVRRHAAVSILDRPGESDLTAHVDFEALARSMREAGAMVWPMMTQRDFLLAMGLELRASILARSATDAQKRELEAAAERVAGQSQMGQLFKVLAATSRGLPCPHPFKACDKAS